MLYVLRYGGNKKDDKYDNLRMTIWHHGILLDFKATVPNVQPLSHIVTNFQPINCHLDLNNYFKIYSTLN